MIVHDLKVNPQFWEAVKNGSKPFEVRRNDRNFKVGDVCRLRQYSHDLGYVGTDEVCYPISYILHNEDFPNGVPIGFVVLGFGVLQEKDDV